MIRPPRMRTALRTAALAVAMVASAGGAMAQSASVAAAAGWTEHAVANGTPAAAIGVDAAFPAAAATVRVGYRRMLVEGSAPDTDALRATARYPVIDMTGVRASAELHAGLSRYARDQDAGLVLAGGLGLHLTPSVSMPIRPYLSVRGLGAFATGTALGESYGAGGLALGVEVGLGTSFGPLVVWLRAARDGFDGGLGATPYPETALELSVGYRL